MEFFNVIGEIRSNRSKFKDWEESENSNDLRRQALYNTHKPSAEKIKTAQDLGNRVIDVVTLMDQHSEDVAEDMEAAVQPMQALVNVAGLLTGVGGAAFITAKNESRIYRRFKEFAQKNSIDYASEIYNKIERANPHKFFYGEDILNFKRLKKMNISIPQECFPQLQNLSKEWAKIARPLKIWRPISVAMAVTIPIGTFVSSILYGTKLQIDASKIARYQSRKEIEDPKYFVNYTPEQIAKAKEDVKNKPPEKRSFWQKLKGDDDRKGFWKNITSIIKDREDYEGWKADDKDDAKIVTRELSEQEIKQAKSDQQLIHRIVKKLNNKAEEYSENMETASEVILSSALLGGPILSGISSFIVNKSGIAKFVIKKLIKSSTGSDELVKDFEKLHAMKKKENPLAYKKVIKQLGRKLDESMWEKFKTQKLGKIAKIKGLLTRISITPLGRFGILAVPTTVISMLIGITIALKLQKAAARAGRFAAREEFKNNPQEYLSYDDKEMESVNHIKAPKKSMLKAFVEHSSFLPRSIKHYSQYQKYKKTGLREEKNLKKELMKQEVNEKQLKDAKNLQKKVFNTFEKVDENSQKYSETMEATNQIIQPLIYAVGYAAFISPILIIGILVAKGKITVGKVANKVLNTLASSSKLMKTKLFKRNLKDICNNITNIIESQEVPTVLKNILNTLDIDAIQTSGKISVSNFKKQLPVLRQIILDANYYDRYRLENMLNIDIIKRLLPRNLKDLLPQSGSLSVTDIIKFLDKLDSLPLEKIPDIKINVDMLKNLMAQNKNNLSKILNLNPKAKLTSLLNYLENIDEEGFAKLKIIIEEKMQKTLSVVNIDKVNKSKVLELINFAEAQLMRRGLDNEIITEHFKTAREAIGKVNPNDAKGLSETAGNYVREALAKLQLNQINEPKETLSRVLREISDKLPDGSIADNISAKALFGKLKSAVNELSDEDFTELNSEKFQAVLRRFLPKLEVGKFDRKAVISVIERLEKVVNNFPKEEAMAELEKVFAKIKANPLKTYILLKENPEKLASTLMTPTLKAILATAGISWGMFCTLISYGLASYFAKLEKEAGRLGVMKSLESLDDYRYYADAEATNNTQGSPEPKATPKQNMINNLLKSNFKAFGV